MSIKEVADEMRAAGIRRARFFPNADGIEELELIDTIPAPPSFEAIPDAPTEPGKDPSLCIGVGCSERAGWHGTGYCRAHGLSAAGVRT